MPREPDIGWQHGKMIGGHRHHVQCNYCHRIMIGGVTRFKKHLARKKGEIKGCEAVPQEVRELIKRHLAAGEVKKARKREIKTDAEPLKALPFDDKDTGSDESDREIAAVRLESLRTLDKDETHIPVVNETKLDHQQFLARSREFNDAFSNGSCKDEQGLAPLRATDPGWDHGVMVDGDRQKIKCKYCDKVILGGGISRLKQHLAGERGNIAPCEEVPEDIKRQMQQHLGFKVLERLKRQKELGVINGPSQESRERNDDMQMGLNATSAHKVRGRRRGKEVDDGTSNRKARTDKLLIAQATPLSQSSVRLTFPSQESIERADMAVAKFMYDTGIPFSAANSLYFQAMADAIAEVGPGYKMPTYHALWGKLLNKSIHEARDLCFELRKSWEVTGCSVIAERWRDKSGHSFINFFVYCPKGTTFVRSVDLSNIEENPDTLTHLFDSIVQEVGPRNVVNFVTECSTSFKAAGKLLMSEYKTFFWSACVTDCIILMLDEMSKIGEVKEVLTKAKRICRFVYNHTWALDLMRKRTGGRDIVWPDMTKSMTDFLTLQSILSLREHVHQLFTSTAWLDSAYSKERAGVEVAGIVLDPQFWSLCARVSKVTKPLIAVLHVAESYERPSMGYIYDAMEKARKSIIVAFNDNESECLSYVNVIDRVWEEQLHSPLHSAACFLNPSIFYSPNFSTNKVIQKGLLDCIETLEPDATAQDMILKQIPCYEDAAGDFNRPVAVRGRETLPPATWWSLYASDYQELQHFAVRILSQTCSGARCKRNWSIFEHTRAKGRNQLEQKRVNDLIFVHYNLCRQQRNMATSGSKILMRSPCDPICFEEEETVGDWVDDSGLLDRKDLGWMDNNLVLSNKVSSGDDRMHCSDDGSSDDSNCNYSSREL